MPLALRDLQHHRSRASAIRCYLFDLLFERGKCWLDVPLADRRAALATKVRPSLRHSLSLPAAALYRPTGLKRDPLQRANLEEPSLRHESAAVSVRCQRSRLVQLRVKQPAEPSRQYLHLPGRKG